MFWSLLSTHFSWVLLIFVPLMICSSVHQDVRTDEVGRGEPGSDWKGKKEGQPACLRTLFGFFGPSSSKRTHGQEQTLKLSFTNYTELLWRKTVRHVPAYINVVTLPCKTVWACVGFIITDCDFYIGLWGSLTTLHTIRDWKALALAPEKCSQLGEQAGVTQTVVSHRKWKN